VILVSVRQQYPTVCHTFISKASAQLWKQGYSEALKLNAEVEESHGCGVRRGSTLTRAHYSLLLPQFPGARDFSRFC
jgi:hypothetical protein